jgi:hypothetical protein
MEEYAVTNEGFSEIATMKAIVSLDDLVKTRLLIQEPVALQRFSHSVCNE